MCAKIKQEAQNPLILRCHRLMEAFAKSDDERDFYIDRLEGLVLSLMTNGPQAAGPVAAAAAIAGSNVPLVGCYSLVVRLRARHLISTTLLRCSSAYDFVQKKSKSIGPNMSYVNSETPESAVTDQEF